VIAMVEKNNLNETTKDIKKEDKKKEGRKRKTLSEQVKELREELQNKEQMFNELKERYLRVLADYDNFRKRMEKEVEEIREYGGEHVLKQILPILDDLERALNSDDEGTNFRKGIELIYKKFVKILKDLGVEQIESLGREFDPYLHHALMVKESKDHPDNTVIEEFEKGYKFKNRVLRHAKVIVSKQ